jgi:hypothetical protein
MRGLWPGRVCAWPRVQYGCPCGNTPSQESATILNSLSMLTCVCEERHFVSVLPMYLCTDNPVTAHLIVIILVPHVVNDKVCSIHSRLQLTEEFLLGLFRACWGPAYGQRPEKVICVPVTSPRWAKP